MNLSRKSSLSNASAVLVALAAAGFQAQVVADTPKASKLTPTKWKRTTDDSIVAKERHEWNMKRDEAYRAKKAAKGKKPHWSALNHFARRVA